MKHKKYMDKNYPGLRELIHKFNKKYNEYHLYFMRDQVWKNADPKASFSLEDKIACVTEYYRNGADGDALYLLRMSEKGAELAYVITEEGYRIYRDETMPEFRNEGKYINKIEMAILETLRQVFVACRGHFDSGIENRIKQYKVGLGIEDL